MSTSPDCSAVKRCWPLTGTYFTFSESPKMAAETARQTSTSMPVHLPWLSTTMKPASPLAAMPQISDPRALMASRSLPAWAVPAIAVRATNTAPPATNFPNFKMWLRPADKRRLELAEARGGALRAERVGAPRRRRLLLGAAMQAARDCRGGARGLLRLGGGRTNILLPLAERNERLRVELAVAVCRHVLRGIDELAVHDRGEVQMRTGRAAGRADVADDVALVDGGARRHARRDARHVGVQRLETVGVRDLHRAAVVVIPVGMVHDAVGGGMDRLADFAFEVDAVVERGARGAAVVAAVTERRGDARVGLGLGEGRAAQAGTFVVVPALGLIAGRVPPVRLLGLAVADRSEQQTRRAVGGLALDHLDLGAGRSEARESLGHFLVAGEARAAGNAAEGGGAGGFDQRDRSRDHGMQAAGDGEVGAHARQVLVFLASDGSGRRRGGNRSRSRRRGGSRSGRGLGGIVIGEPLGVQLIG